MLVAEIPLAEAATTDSGAGVCRERGLDVDESAEETRFLKRETKDVVRSFERGEDLSDILFGQGKKSRWVDWPVRT